MNCLIIGGGVVGLMTAREFAAEGFSVRIIERGDFGRESSWAGGGILSPLRPWLAPEPVTALAQWSRIAYEGLAAELRDATGTDVELLHSGLLSLEVARATEAMAWSYRHGIHCELLETADAVSAIEPGCRAATALWFPDVAQVRNPRLIHALEQDVARRGIQMLPRRAVEGIVVRLIDGLVEADAIIVAAGAWTAQLLRPLGVVLDVDPVKGQMLMYRAAPDTVRRIVTDGEHYVIPRRDGHVLVGSTVERTGFDKSITGPARRQLSRAAQRLVPALGRCEIVQQWAGLRPGSPAGVPFISQIPEVEGLYVNAGHFRNGLLLAPASARLMVDVMLGRTPIIDPAPFKVLSG